MKFTKKFSTKVGTQFVAVWEFNDKIWSDTYILKEDGLEIYSEEADAFVNIDVDLLGWAQGDRAVKYVVL